MKTKNKSGPINKFTGKVMTEDEIEKILEQKRNADSCNTQFPDCPTKPNNSSCKNCPLYRTEK